MANHILPVEREVTTSSVFDVAKGRSANMRAKVVKKINEATRNHHLISNTYKDILRSLINVTNSVKYINSQDQIMEVKAIHGNRERAIAKKLQKENIRLPIIAVVQTNSDEAPDRQRYESNLIHEVVWDDDKQRAQRVLSMAPKAITINYKIGIWAKYMEDKDQILEQLRLLFKPDLEVPISESTLLKAYIDTESQDSDLTLGDGQDRVIRHSIFIRVEGYIPNPRFLITNTGEIEQYNLDICLYSGD